MALVLAPSVTGAVVLVCLVWRPMQDERVPGPAAAATIAFALATWMHGSGTALPPPAFAARQPRAGLRLTLAWIAGTLTGAALTGHPLAFLWHAAENAYLTTGGALTIPSMATELRPSQSSPIAALVVLGLLLWRRVRGGAATSLTRDPTFLLAAVCWVLGSLAERFWVDLGWPALLVWMAEEIQDSLEERTGAGDPGRLALVSIVGVSAVLVLGANLQGRWDRPYDPRREFLTAFSETDPGTCLAARPDGHSYTNDMRLLPDVHQSHGALALRLA
jgi:hypothetical protein